MGCDIHGVVEVFIDGSWNQAMDIGDLSPRNYSLFALLFGVRGSSPYAYKYRGWPSDRAWQTGYQFCDECQGNGHEESGSERLEQYHKHDTGYCEHCVDWHSLSYITIQELEQHWDEVMNTIKGIVKGPTMDIPWHNQEWQFVFDTMRFWTVYLKDQKQIIESTPALSTGQEDTSRVRLIVWFDN